MSAVADAANRPTDAEAPFEDASLSIASPFQDDGVNAAFADPEPSVGSTSRWTAEGADASDEEGERAAAYREAAEGAAAPSAEASTPDDRADAADDETNLEAAQDGHDAADDDAHDEDAHDEDAHDHGAHDEDAHDDSAHDDGSDTLEKASAVAAPAEADEPGPVDGVLEIVICGQAAAMACGDDDAPRLRRIAAAINRAGAGLAEAGIVSARPLEDARFMFMAAMTIADEMLGLEARFAEAQAQLELQDRQLRALRQRARRAEAAQAAAEEKLANTVEQHASAARQAFEASFAEVVSKAAKRLEAAAGRLEGR